MYNQKKDKTQYIQMKGLKIKGQQKIDRIRMN